MATVPVSQATRPYALTRVTTADVLDATIIDKEGSSPRSITIQDMVRSGPAATTSSAGLLGASDKTKLDGVEEGATANTKALVGDVSGLTDDLKFLTVARGADLVPIAPVTPTGGARPRPIKDILGETKDLFNLRRPADTDYGYAVSHTGGDPTYVPSGLHATGLGHYDFGDHHLFGPGNVVAGGYKQAQRRIFQTAPAVQPSDDRLQFFDADWSKALTEYKFVGTGATGAPGSVYKNFPTLAVRATVYDFTGGYNSAVNDHGGGRSGVFTRIDRVYHGGQGDLAGQTFFGEVYSALPGATHWLANPALIHHNFNLGAVGSATGAFLNHSEGIYSDSGLAVTAVDRVRNYTRTNAGNALYQVWVHDRPQSGGSQPIDAFYSPAGKARSGLDFTPSDFSSNDYGAIRLKPGDKVKFACVATPDPLGIKWWGDQDYTCEMFFDLGNSAFVLNPGGGRTLKMAPDPSSKASFFGVTGAGRQTITGSRGGNAALASLLTALANFGLITDSTT